MIPWNYERMSTPVVLVNTYKHLHCLCLISYPEGISSVRTLSYCIIYRSSSRPRDLISEAQLDLQYGRWWLKLWEKLVNIQTRTGRYTLGWILQGTGCTFSTLTNSSLLTRSFHAPTSDIWVSLPIPLKPLFFLGALHHPYFQIDELLYESQVVQQISQLVSSGMNIYSKW